MVVGEPLVGQAGVEGFEVLAHALEVVGQQQVAKAGARHHALSGLRGPIVEQTVLRLCCTSRLG